MTAAGSPMEWWIIGFRFTVPADLKETKNGRDVKR